MVLSPLISFGIIVHNGEPFTRYCLRALYPFAHQIIVVEGAVPAAAAVATDNGHSRDGTLQVLRDFQAYEDPDDKLLIITAEDAGYPDGFWPGEKQEQSQAYASRITGDYLWQVDIDEFYQPGDMQYVLELLQSSPDVTAVSFRQLTFWGGFDYWTDGWYLWRDLPQIHRIFRWRGGYRYASHRPPTVLDALGRDLRTIRWIDGFALEKRGTYMYHYSLVFPHQVVNKSVYYGQADWTYRPHANRWVENAYLSLRRPFRFHNVYDYPSWLERFSGHHPPQIGKLRADIAGGQYPVALRPTDDIERLVRTWPYRLGRAILKRTLFGAELVALSLLWRGRLRSLRTNPRRALRRFGQRLLGQQPT